MKYVSALTKSLVHTVKDWIASTPNQGEMKSDEDPVESDDLTITDENEQQNMEIETVNECMNSLPSDLTGSQSLLLTNQTLDPVRKHTSQEEFERRIRTPESALEFAQECGLLPSSVSCPACGKIPIAASQKKQQRSGGEYKSEKKIGGLGKTVEVDEAHMIRSKGRRGKGRTGYWMVGGCEVGNPSAYFVEMVASRDRATLEEVCNRRIKKGTEIVTDLWKGYGFADTKKKKHNTVNHSRNEWVGRDGATTNHIEARWKHVRASLPKNGVPRWFHEGYIQAEQLRKMPWTFQDFLRECGSVTNDQLDLMMSFEDEEKQATIKLLTVDNDRRKKNAELIQKSDKAIRSHHNRKRKVIQKQQSLAQIQLDIVHEVQPQLEEEWGPDSPRFLPPIQKTKRTRSTNRNPDFYYPSISKKERRKPGLVQSLLQQLQKKWHEFKVENVVGDGNCGFYAVQKSLTPEELEAHPDLRGELAEWERTNSHFFEEFGDNFEEVDFSTIPTLGSSVLVTQNL
ncbi:hypothetical protein BLNAU_14859 [Blattamonas nauphoetae]|uniref:OTU domain-containing protein n=1 Tax=Blattamonas nauphoetae TaxID=2049346 RepID=A0ABQ9XCD7_9EUKA|nr:hypothetical protein BLNAU_14859 [Blattamonas nauphoetae]